MRRILMHLAIGEDYHAGSKAMKDCETILQKKGYSLMNMKHREGKLGIIGKIRNECEYLSFFSLKKDDIFIIQHPQYIGSRYMKWLAAAKKIKKFKTIYIVHDLESLRKMFIEWADIFEEIDAKMIETADSMIVHNARMKEYLAIKRGVSQNKMVNLEVFDYLTDQEPKSAVGERKADIVIAGNLKPEKSGYVYKLLESFPELSLNLYGVGFPKSWESKAGESYRGAFPADILPGKLDGRFGLVWDGEEISSCAGTTGEYLKYNNPHKVSLYIAAGLPIIIWEKAALADFVCKNKIGIAVGNLKNLKTILGTISEQEYTVMKNNIQKISEKVRRGDYMGKAIESAEKILGKNQ